MRSWIVLYMWARDSLIWPDKLIYKNKENLSTTFIGSRVDVRSVDIVYHTGLFSHIRPRFM